MYRSLKYLFFVLLLSQSSIVAKAQGGLCPVNMDFELGDFTNWSCTYGDVIDSTAPDLTHWNVYHPTPTAPIPGRHTIISQATAGLDPWGNFPQLCPNGSGYSVKLGNAVGGHQGEGISYSYTIPASATFFSIVYHYAVVLYDGGHLPWEQPRFRARIVDQSTNNPLPCVTFDFTASASLPGFRPSPLDHNVWYKNWTPITLTLDGYAGRTILLEFITSDCTFTAHWGYAYMDVNSNCNGEIDGSTICIGDTSITLNAPAGYQAYTWYADNTFATVLSTSQSLTLNPPPTVGSLFPVVVEPYAGFGCQDTLFARISISPKPPSVAGADASICDGLQTQMGGPPTVGYTYSWTPASQVSNPIIPDPFGWNNGASSPGTEFIVKTTDILTGCYSYDTTYIDTYKVDTAISLVGKGEYCIGDPSAGTLAVSNVLSAVQWYDASGPLPGATGLTYHPTLPGSYWAQVVENGCTDSTATLPILIHPLPVAAFTPIIDTGCVTSNSRTFTNASTVSDASVLSYEWRFSDGDILHTQDVIKTFAFLGLHNIEMVTTSAYGCKDSTGGTVQIFPNGVPNFNWDSICANRPMLFTNLSNENSSPFVKYSWTFNNGGPGSLIKDPLPVTYTIPGRVDVKLDMVNIGCENDPQSITKSILVNPVAPGVRYRDWTIPLGASKMIHVRDTIGNIYNWRPPIQLSSYNAQYTEFYATGSDVQYLIDITNEHTCVTTDTMWMYILKKPGYYLPTAFTPNGDGLNDVIKPYLVGLKSLRNFSIFNRWGNRMFFTTREGEGWDGKIKGVEQATGVYVWVLEYVDINDKTITAKGMITLIR